MALVNPNAGEHKDIRNIIVRMEFEPANYHIKILRISHHATLDPPNKAKFRR